MRGQKPSKVIIDTNIWISFLIGKELGNLKELIVSEKVKLVTTRQLINEIKLVSSRDKLRKYFNQDKVAGLIALLDVIAEDVEIRKIVKVCRDPKDDFLLALAKASRADFLITSDRDLLDLKKYSWTRIVTVTQFREEVS